MIWKRKGGGRAASPIFGLPPVEAFSSEWCILQFLKDWTDDDIRLAVRRNIDLAELIFNYQEEASPVLGFVKGSGYDVKEPWVNPDNALRWFQIRRPDLYTALVETNSGVIWIKWNMEKLKRIL